MSCCKTKEKIIIHRRTVNPILVSNETLISKGINPSFEYEKDPILSREISDGYKFLEGRNADLPIGVVEHEWDGIDSELIFYIPRS